MGPVHCSWDPQVLYSATFFIKNRSHSTIHTFKKLFCYNIFSFQRYPKGPLVGQGTLQWQRLCVGLVGGFNGIFIFVIHCRIGRKNLLTGLWTLFTLRKCRGLALIRFVGSQKGVEFLRLEVFIFLSTFLLFLSLRGWCGNQRFLQGWLSFHDQLL